jgi:4-amino-4-deoxy-L-arabinose transferase-like glycosyltransferase
MTRLFAQEPNGLLYALLTRPLMALGHSEWILRLPALIGGVLAVAALWWAARELDLREAAPAAAALLAVSPLAVKISADARPYSLVVLTCCLSVATLARAARNGGVRWWAAYASCLTALAYLNALALLVIVVHVLVVGRRNPRPWSAWLASLATAGLASIPIAVLLVRDRARRNPLYWLSGHSIGDLARETAKFFGYHPVLAMAELTLVGATAFVSRRYLAGTPVSRYLRHPLSPVVGWAVLPPLLAFALSQITPVLKDRYFIVALPGVCLLVAACLLRWRRSTSAALLALLLLGSAAVTVAWVWRPQRLGEDWRGAVHRLDAMRLPGEPVIFDGVDGLAAAGYYSRAFRLEDGRAVVTQWDHRLPPGVAAYQKPGGYSDVPVGPVSAATMAEQVGRTGRVFVVEMDYDLGGKGAFTGPGAQWARAHCDVGYHVFTRVVLVVVTKCAPAGS